MRIWRKKKYEGKRSPKVSYPDEYPGSGFCGGTLVSSRHVITAAHCMLVSDKKNVWYITSEETKDTIAVRVGDHNVLTEGEEILKPLFVNIDKIIKHPKWVQDVPGLENLGNTFDIAILELEYALNINTYTPACLAKPSDGTFDDQSGTLVGWGVDVEFPYLHFPDVPMEVDLTIIPAGAGPNSVSHGTECVKSLRCRYLHMPDIVYCMYINDFIRISCVPISLMCAGLQQPQKGGCFVSVQFTQRMVQFLYLG